uniref:Thioredoxin-like fold domain-containing protein n=1 Tax=Thermofilum pendens TaxID=2269 RepID=A0A7J3X9H7_THEPE
MKLGKTKVALLAAVLIASLAAGAVLLLRGFEGSLLPSPTGPAEPEAECAEPSIVYVYATDAQKHAADEVTSSLKMMLQQRGVNVINLPVCVVPASSFEKRFQVYPALLIRGNVTVPSDYVSCTFGNYKELYPLLSAIIAHYSGVQVSYGYGGEAFLVVSTAPLTSFPHEQPNLGEILSRVFLVNVSSVEKVTPEALPFKLEVLPAVVVRSDYNISGGAPYIVPLQGSFYTVREDLHRRLLQSLGVFAYELSRSPPPILEEGVSLGAAGAPTLYILEDYHCPYCAKFYKANTALLLELVKQGKLRVVFVDLVVHPEVAPMHAFTWCLYNRTGSAYLYFNVSSGLYELFLKSTTTSLDDAVRVALDFTSAEVINESKACMPLREHTIQELSSSLAKLGFTGTPTFVFWNPATGRGLVVEGCLDWDVCIKEEDFVKVLNWLSQAG